MRYKSPGSEASQICGQYYVFPLKTGTVERTGSHVEKSLQGYPLLMLCMILRKDCNHFLETINESVFLVQEVRNVPNTCNSGKLFPWIVPVIATVCFSSQLAIYESYCDCPIVSIDSTVSTTVLGIISMVSNTKKSRLSSVKGFPISSVTEVKNMTQKHAVRLEFVWGVGYHRFVVSEMSLQTL